MECSCHACKSACSKKPGWFAPGEAEKAAEYLDMPFDQFFNEKLGVDYWSSSEENIFVLAPALKYGETGQEYPFDPHGECIFYENGLCSIHPVKPRECALYDHTVNHEGSMNNKIDIKNEWVKNQNQIEEIMGRKPEVAVPDLEGFLSILQHLLRRTNE